VWSGSAAAQVKPGLTDTVKSRHRYPPPNPGPRRLRIFTRRRIASQLSRQQQERELRFRFFTAQGIGSDDAILTLNASGSWSSPRFHGLLGRNGLWPDPEMAAREVSDAKTLG